MRPSHPGVTVTDRPVHPSQPAEQTAATLTVHAGDLLASAADALVCPTNTVGPMGAGLARAFATRFPGLERDYRIACDRGEAHIGRVWRWATLLPPAVLCLPTKDHYHDHSRRRDIDQGLADLAARVGEWGIGSLAVPALGCGNGGLAWRQVATLLHRHLASLPIPVQVYAPLEVPAAQATTAFLADPTIADPPASCPRVLRWTRRGLAPGAVYIGRAAARCDLPASPLANPYRLPNPGDRVARRHSLERYRAWLHARAATDADVRAELDRTRGQDLVCWCAPAPCHGDVILAWHLRHPAPGDQAAAQLAGQLATLEQTVAAADAERLAIVVSEQLGPPRNHVLARLIVVDEILRLRPARLISGGCDGVDTVAARAAKSLGMDPHQQVAAGCTALERIWWHGSRSHGSGWTFDRARDVGKPAGQVRL